MKKRFPLVGSLVNRGSNPETFIDFDQKFVNVYPEPTRNVITGAGSVALYKRLGMTGVNNAPASYAGLGGAIWWSGGNRAVFPYINGTTLAVYDSNLAIIGATIANVSGWPLITETTYNGKATLTMTLRKSTDSFQHAYYFSEGDVAWTEITDVDYPVNQAPQLSTFGRMVHLDGYAFVIDLNGKIWNSDLNNITSWNSTSFVTAEKSPDAGAGLAITKNLVVAFGAGSIEFFQNTGNATGSPLTRIPSAAINLGSTTVGTGFNPSHIEVGDSIYFFAHGTGNQQIGVYRLTGTALQKISTPAIDKIILQELSNYLYGWAGTFKSHGMTHLLMYQGNTVIADVPCYCIETGVWWYFKSDIVVRSCLSAATKSYFTGSSSGGLTRKLYTMDSASPVFQDDGATFTATIQTQPIDHGTDNLKECTAFRLIADTQSTAGTVSVSYSDNDYSSFSTAKTIDMTQKQKKLDAGLGWFRSRSWKIVDSANRPFRAEAFEVEWEESEE